MWPKFLAGTRPRPDTTLSARAGTLPEGFTFSRASGATRIDSRGYLETVAADVARYTHNPTLEYNHAVNPWFDGALEGDFASGAVPVPNMGQFFLHGGLTAAIVAKRRDSSAETLDIRFTGTPINNSTNWSFINYLDQSVAAGQPLTIGLGLAIVGGSVANITKIHFTSEVGSAYEETPNLTPLLTSAVQDFSVTATDPAAATFIAGSFWLSVTVGQPVNITLRFRFPRATLNATDILNRVPLATLAARINGTPQYGLEGLLVERISATNGVRNPRAEGLVPQTYAPGVPGGGSNFVGITNWFIQNRGSGLSMDVSAITAAGRSGVRVRWYGTTPASPGTDSIEFEARNIIGAQTGIPVTGSFETRLVAGALPAGMANFSIRVITFTNAGVVVDNSTKPGNIPLSASIDLQSWTITPGAGVSTNGWVCTGLQAAGWPASTAVDFTIDVFCPQLETGSFASSRILPPPGAPAATTRAADILNIDPALIDLDRSSIAMRFRIERGGVGVANGSSSNQTVFAATTATNTDALRLQTSPAATFPAAVSRRTSITTNIALSGIGSGTFQSTAVSWAGGTSSASWNGGLTATVASSPVGPATAVEVGSDGFGSLAGNLTLQYLRIWKGRRLSTAQIQRESARTA